MGQKSMIDQTGFERLLLWLNPNRDKAAEKYEAVRRRLVEVFASRGFPDAERLADDTIDRVTLKVERIMEGWVGDPVYYFLGVARKVILERKKLPPVVIPPPPPDEDEQERREREDQCLERCLALQPQGDRELILHYVDGNKKQRQEQAQGLGITLNALRIRVYQIKTAIRPCIKHCCKEDASPRNHMPQVVI
jgi:DNA-directed RNA polymerase specialized sigma24 family protein